MRNSFIDELCKLAAEDPRIWLVCGDIGFSVLEKFREQFPGRFLNAGVAEQNMTGVAAGLAMTGKVVFTYSIANFPVMRCLEQIRNDVCYHKLSVKIVAVGGGLAYGSHGYTHHAVEDLAVMSVMPNMVVAAPGDPHETRSIMRIFADIPGPGYLRLGKAGEPAVHEGPIACELGKAIWMQHGEDVTLFSTGAMLHTTLSAVEKLRAQGIRAGLVSVPFLVPFDSGAVQMAAYESGAIVSVEEHGPGGLAPAVAEAIAISGLRTAFVPLRLQRQPIKFSGSQEMLRGTQGLSSEAIAETTAQMVRSKQT